VFGIDFSDQQALWLNITNIALGVVTVVCFVVVGWGVVGEVVARVRKRWGLAASLDDHAFVLPVLGTTMADGGEKLPEEPKP